MSDLLRLYSRMLFVSQTCKQSAHCHIGVRNIKQVSHIK